MAFRYLSYYKIVNMPIPMRWIGNGTGIQRMIQGCRKYGVREPEFIDMGDAFRVNFYRSGVGTGTEKEDIMVLSAEKLSNRFRVIWAEASRRAGKYCGRVS